MSKMNAYASYGEGPDASPGKGAVTKWSVEWRQTFVWQEVWFPIYTQLPAVESVEQTMAAKEHDVDASDASPTGRYVACGCGAWIYEDRITSRPHCQQCGRKWKSRAARQSNVSRLRAGSSDAAPPVAEGTASPPVAEDMAALPVSYLSPAVESTAGEVDKSNLQRAASRGVPKASTATLDCQSISSRSSAHSSIVDEVSVTLAPSLMPQDAVKHCPDGRLSNHILLDSGCSNSSHDRTNTLAPSPTPQDAVQHGPDGRLSNHILLDSGCDNSSHDRTSSDELWKRRRGRRGRGRQRRTQLRRRHLHDKAADVTEDVEKESAIAACSPAGLRQEPTDEAPEWLSETEGRSQVRRKQELTLVEVLEARIARTASSRLAADAPERRPARGASNQDGQELGSNSDSSQPRNQEVPACDTERGSGDSQPQRDGTQRGPEGQQRNIQMVNISRGPDGQPRRGDHAAANKSECDQKGCTSGTVEMSSALVADKLADLVAKLRDWSPERQWDSDILPQLQQCLGVATQLHEDSLISAARQAIAIAQRRQSQG